MPNKIIIRNARVHNLKNLSVDIPKNKLVVITGISGSGKSSLAFDTIYAEGQRRYVESLSSYARQFLGVMEKPDVDKIEGLSPAISIDQRSVSRNSRSTVGTITEIYDYLRLLYAKVGRPHCPKCGVEITQQTKKQILEKILKLPEATRFNLLAPMVRQKKGEHKAILEEIKNAGYERVRVDGASCLTSEIEDVELDRKKTHSIDIIIDSLVINKNTRLQLADSLEMALELGNGTVIAAISNGTKQDILYSKFFVCPKCGLSITPFSPRDFSFNSPHGACSECSGLGVKLRVDPSLVIPNKSLTLAQGAIRPWVSSVSGKKSLYSQILEALANEYNFSLDTPVKDLPQKALNTVLYGTNGQMITLANGDEKETRLIFEGVVADLEKRYRDTNSDYMRQETEIYMRTEECPKCHGKRLKPEALAVKLAGKSIDAVVNSSIEKNVRFFKEILEKKGENKNLLTDKEYFIGHQIIREVVARLKYLEDVGLEYLTLDRSAATLAGGEAQRIRLATQIGSGLSGVIYILDEPTIGLHQRDVEKLIVTLKKLRDLENTVIVVEHDEQIICSADEIIDVGPGAGKNGGELIFQGTFGKIKRAKKSLTGQYLSGEKKVELIKKIRKDSKKYITVFGAREFNLKNIDVKIPLGKFVCITGVSGSGKSTLVDEILGKFLAKKFYHAKDEPGKHKKITGIENIDKVVRIDQSPIGRTPRSNLATYTGAFNYIREIFAESAEAKMQGYNASHFSFNVRSGQCETCQGEGYVRFEMQFLPDVYVKCEECQGKRYTKKVLEVHYKGKNIAENLEMTVDEAYQFFQNIPALKQRLEVLKDVGLGYVELGQPATTLSGGEAQRIKLATELSRKATGKTLYILDEPTTGLHFDDTQKLLHVLSCLVDKGNTVLIIEHNLDVIRASDWVIDLGPEGGDKGGEIVAIGMPKDVMKCKKSYTGQFLKKGVKCR